MLQPLDRFCDLNWTSVNFGISVFKPRRRQCESELSYDVLGPTGMICNVRILLGRLSNAFAHTVERVGVNDAGPGMIERRAACAA